MSNGDESLSPDELAALSEAFSGGDRAERSSADVRGDQETVVLRYDLIGSSSSQRHDFPALDLIHEGFSAALATAIQEAANDEAHFIPKPPDVLSFSEVYGSLSMPCCVIVLDVKGLDCPGLLMVDPGVFVTWVDRMMGGLGGALDPGQLLNSRGFTATERHLIQSLVDIVSKCAADAWDEITPVNIQMLRAVVDPRHSAVFMPSDQVVDFRLDVEWGEVSGDIRLVLPMIALRPHAERLARTAVSPPSAGDADWRVSMTDALEDVPVTLTAVLGNTHLTLREILNLKAGDHLRLDRDPNQPLPMQVEGITRYEIRPKVEHGNIAAVMGSSVNLAEIATEPEEQG